MASSSTTGSSSSTTTGSVHLAQSGDSLSEDDLIIEMGARAPNRRGHKVHCSFQKRPFIIGVSGGTSSGKSTVCSKIMEKLGPIDPTSIYLSHEKRVVVISQDSFYRKLDDTDRALVAAGNFNFDHPEAFDLPKMVKTLYDILNGRLVKVPVYDYKNNEISDAEQVIYPADVVLVEGLLLFYFPELRRLFNMKIFVDTDPDTRLSRRVMKDVQELNRQLDVVLNQYTKYVKPSFEEFCLPSKKYADIIVPRGPDNEVAVDLIVAHVRGIYDPSVRHESIQLENFDNGQSLLSLSSAKKRNKKAAKKAAAPQQPSSTPSKRDVIPVVPTAKEALRKSKSSMADFHSTAPGSVVTAAAKKPAKASIVATEPEANVATGLVNGFKMAIDVIVESIRDKLICKSQHRQAQRRHHHQHHSNDSTTNARRRSSTIAHQTRNGHNFNSTPSTPIGQAMIIESMRAAALDVCRHHEHDDNAANRGDDDDDEGGGLRSQQGKPQPARQRHFSDL